MNRGAMLVRPFGKLLAVVFAFDLAFLAIPTTDGVIHGSSARAADDKNRPATVADLARLESEIREQRTVILHLLKAEQERSEVMLKLLEGRCGGGSAGDLGRSRSSAADSDTTSSRSAVAAAGGDAAMDASAAAGAVVTIKGRVQGSGGDLQNVYVYLDGMRSSGKGKSLEIVQKGKQFSPQMAVAIAGTKVTFPNRDVMFHNVFSPSPPKPFDLGTRQAGETGPTVELDTPGVIDVYCNIHSRMAAKILVVPNRVFVKIGADGTFRLDKVPVGKRKLVAWGPGFKPQRRDVDATANGADVVFSLEADPTKAHTNKSGMPYGSYKD